MNKLYEWFYVKQQMRTKRIGERIGMVVENEEAFNKEMLAQAKNDMFFWGLALIMFIYVIFKWLVR